MSSDAELEVLGWRDGHIVALDQTALPHEIRMLHLTTVAELVDAIGRLAIRGAPVLGAAGALGVALAARLAERDGWDAARLDAAVKQLAEARPTAVNLRRETEAVDMISAQMQAELKRARADFVIENSGSLASLDARVAEVWADLTREATALAHSLTA